jgi:23S rRNA (adenine2503-C2)-methyltransferase
MTRGEMAALVEGGGFPAFRGKQLFEWVYRHGAAEFDAMTNLPKAMRGWLAERVVIGGGRLVRAQGRPEGTRKVLFELGDGKFIESVLMRDEGKERTSLCVSSQVGCAVGCTFCLTGYGGYQRQLAVDEIVGQVLEVRRQLLLEGERLQGMVFMGMGEPMLNLDAVVKAIRIISDPEGIAMSARRITVSTSGVIPGIEAFGRAQTGANLAVSLNATTDAVRTSIMPLNKRWPIRALIDALARFPMSPRQRITVEYVLLKGINDTAEDAARLVELLRPLRCKVNLIMFNPHEYLHYEPVDMGTLDRFAETLAAGHYTVSVRWSKGAEIEAACGQLAAHHFEKAGAGA